MAPQLLAPALAFVTACVPPAFLKPEAQVAHSHDRFTGHDTTSIDFNYSRSFRLEGRGSVRYVEGEHVATLRLTFQGHFDYATCHDVAMAVDGHPQPLGEVNYETRVDSAGAIEELAMVVPRETLESWLPSEAIELRVCKDANAVTSTERDGMKEFVREVLPELARVEP